jgi:hypothetical protein
MKHNKFKHLIIGFFHLTQLAFVQLHIAKHQHLTHCGDAKVAYSRLQP